MKRALLWGSGAVGAAAAVAMLGKRSRIDVRGRVVLITGGSRGLGLALAREFASRGANLARISAETRIPVASVCVGARGGVYASAVKVILRPQWQPRIC